MRKRAREEEAASMEEEPTMLMMMMMMAPSNEYQNQMLAHPTTPSPTWRLYHNPFYSPSLNTHHLHYTPANPPSLELTTIMNELDLAKALVEDLKAEVELERRMRKTAEAASKKLARELVEAREAGETAKEEMERLKKEVEEERRMLRMAEVWREERVQMKMADARLLMEEKLAELARPKEAHHDSQLIPPPPLPSPPPPTPSSSSTTANCLVLKQGSCQRKGSPESDNPHIVRGIKGYVEFPRVIRAVSSRGRPMGSKVECQKAQLKLLLRHRSPVAVVAGVNSVTVG